MSFGVELWDQVKLLEQYSHQNVQFLHEINDFMKKRSAIEQEYAKSLDKLAKFHKEELTRQAKDATRSWNKALQSGTVMQTWLQVLNQTEAVAAGHEKATEEFDNNFRKQVKRQSEENDKAHKKQFDDIRKAHAELLRIQDNVVKLHERYDTCVKSMETARAAYEKANNDQNATKKDVERLRVESEKRALATQEARNAYTAGIESANAKKDQHFREQLPALLDAVQSSDEQNRIAFLKGMFEKWATLFNSLTPLNEQAWSAVQQAAGCISPTYDSNLLVKMCKTGDGYPADFQFEAKEDVVTPTRGGMSPTSPASGADQADHEELTEDNIINMVWKQGGKKRAHARVKALEREIVDAEKKRANVDLLLQAEKHRPTSPKALNDILSQLRTLHERINGLRQRQYHVACYIAQNDGSGTPETPIQYEVENLTPDTESPVVAKAAAVQNPRFAGLPSQSGSRVDLNQRSMSRMQTGASIAESPAGSPARGAATASSDGASGPHDGGSNPMMSEAAAISEAPELEQDESRPPPPVESGAEAEAGASDDAAASSDAVGGAETANPVTGGSTEAVDGAAPPAIDTSDAIKYKMDYDFEANPDSQEISVPGGTIIEVLAKQEDGWWCARLPDGREGYIPGTYCSPA